MDVIEVGGGAVEARPPGSVEEFLAGHRRPLLRVAHGLCTSREEAEDLLHDTLVKALPRWQRIAGMEHPGAYLRTMLLHEFLRTRRRAARTPVVHLRAPYDDAGADSIAHVDDVDAAMARLRDLPPRARAVLCLRYVEDLDDREIARVLGITTSTVRVTAHKALARLRVGAAMSDEPERRA